MTSPQPASWSRRRFLRTSAAPGAAATTLGLAGCLAGSSESAGTGIELTSLDVAGSPGGDVHLRRAGALSLLDFFATWCAPCKPQMGELRDVRDRFDADTLHVVSVTTETDQGAIRSFWREYEGTWPVTIDADLAANQRYGIRGVPTMVLVDSEGTEHWRHTGLAAAETVTERVEAAGEG